MADKSIFELPVQTTFAVNDRLVIGNYANSDAEAITGQTLINLLATALDGHGGIASIAKTGSSGTNPVVDTYTITMADTTTTTFSITNGVKGDTGDQTYVYFRYAHTEPSTWADTTDQPDDWMGVYAGTATTPPTTVSAYAWYGIKGATGATGAASSITTQNVSYQTSNSGTVAPSGSWTTTIPTVTPGEFLWTRTQLLFNDGTTVTAYSVSRYGIDGTGAVSSVNGVSPDAYGNVALTATDIPVSDNTSIQAHITDIESDVSDLQTSLGKVRKRNFILIGDSFGAGLTPNVSQSNWKGWEYWFDNAFGNVYTIHTCSPTIAGASGFASSLPFETMLAAEESTYSSFADEVTDIVVLGGMNDDTSNESNIKSAIASFCSYCATHYQNATVRIGCIGSDFGKMYSMGKIYEYCTECGAIYMPDGRGLYSDTTYISSDGTHLTQAGYEYYKGYTNNLIADGHCHFSFKKDSQLSISCGTATGTYYLRCVITENTICMNVIPNSGTNVVINSATNPQSGSFQFATFTSPFKNIPYLQENYLINGLNLHRGSSGEYAVYGTITLLVETQASPSPKLSGFANSMAFYSNGDIRGGCAPCTIPY